MANTVALVAVLTMATATTTFAQTPPAAVIGIGAPPTAELGEQVTLQARLVDDSGDPIAGAAVIFTDPSRFLNARSDVVVAQATTDSQGLAVAHYETRQTGPRVISAEFRGNERHGPTKARAEMVVADTDRQLYVERAGVQIPGLNTPPPLGPQMLGLAPPFAFLADLATLGPPLSGWPIAMALSIVWLLYTYVVALMFRVATITVGPAVPSPTAGAGPDSTSPQ